MQEPVMFRGVGAEAIQSSRCRFLTILNANTGCLDTVEARFNEVARDWPNLFV